MIATTTILTDKNNMLTLTPDNVDPWPGEVPNGASVTITVTGTVATGVKDEDQIIALSDEAIVAPKGACVEYTWEPSIECGEEVSCTTARLDELTPETRIAVLDDNNCVTQHITLEQLMTYVNKNAETPELCDLIDLEQDQPTADVKMIGVNENCEVVSIPASAFDCTMADPEAFSCE